MSFANTLALTQFDKRGRFYLKNHIQHRLDVKTGDQFEVWVHLKNKEILLKPYL